MNKLNLPEAIGCPWHGLCTDDVFTGGPSPGRVVATRPAGATFGPAIPILHPSAPGTGKLNGGNERSYGLYVGHNRAINGASGGTGIGWNRWLYCDPVTDATWLMRFEHDDGAGSTTIEVWCDGVFGRFGRTYDTTPRSLGTLAWVPEIPSWDTYGYSATNVMPQLLWGAHPQLAISRDGSEVYLHIFTNTGASINKDLYYPTNQRGAWWGLNSGFPTIGIIKIALSGSNTAAEGGVDLTATITKDLDYEGGMVTSHTRTGTDTSHTAIFYKTEDGVCKRTFDYTFSTRAFNVTYDLWDVTISDSGIATVLEASGHECIIFAQNAVYVATYKEDVTLNEFIQKWVALDIFGDAYTIGTYTSYSSYVAPNSVYHEMPYTRKWVGSFDPANPIGTWGATVGDAVYLTEYTGTTYQYI